MADYTDSTTVGEGYWDADFTGIALFHIWAAGGGGAGGTPGVRGGGPGGGGAYVVHPQPVTEGGRYYYTLGAGGEGGNGGGPGAAQPGSAGQDSFVGRAPDITVRAAGGKGGLLNAAGAGGAAEDCIGDARTSGGTGVMKSGSKVFEGGNGGKGGGDQGGAGGINNSQNTGATTSGHGKAPGGGGAGDGQLNGGKGGTGGNGRIFITQAPTVLPGYYSPGVNNWVFEGAGDSDWTSPADGVAIMEVVGGGGGGIGGDGINGGKGGGGGEYAYKAQNVTKGQVWVRHRGAGGARSLWGSSTTTDGGDSWIALKNSPFTEAVRAKGGKRASTRGASGTAPAGGTGGTGSATVDGDAGGHAYNVAPNFGDGGNGGGGALPYGGEGGWGGNTGTNTTNDGEPGQPPGGGGGGGRNITGGDGGAGADGAATIKYILALVLLSEVGVDGAQETRYGTQIYYKDADGTTHDITVNGSEIGVVRSGALNTDTRLVVPDPGAGRRKPPDYIPAGTEALFDAETGLFNGRVGCSRVHDRLAEVVAGTRPFFSFGGPGDSVYEGWTSLSSTGVATADFPNAFPRRTRAQLATALGVQEAGTGFIRASSYLRDPQWVFSSGWTDNTHYMASSDPARTGTFTSTMAGTEVAVITAGAACTVTIDGVAVAPTTASASGVLTRKVYSGLSNAVHTVVIKPGAGGSQVYGASVHKSSGILVHNLGQGGTFIALGGETSPKQDVWGNFDPHPPGGPVAPASMNKVYTQQTAMFGAPLDLVLPFLGGNDSYKGTGAADIAAAFEWTMQEWADPQSDIMLMPDVHTADRSAALMQVALDNDWAYLDVFWLTRGLKSIFGKNYNGDIYGHLNLAGANWMGQFVTNALLSL